MAGSFIIPVIPHIPDPTDIVKDKTLANVAKNLQDISIINGKLITGTFSTSGDLSNGITINSSSNLTIYHNLGRKWTGWIVVRSFGLNPARLKESITQPSDPSKTLSLYAVDTCTFHLWVF